MAAWSGRQAMARLTVVRATPNRYMSSFSDGTGCPTASSPDSMRPSSHAAICRRAGARARDDAIAREAVGTYRVADHSVGPYCEALARREIRLRLAVGQYGGHHDMHPGPRRELLVPRNHCGEVLAIRRLDEAAGVCRGGARCAREPSHKTLMCRRIGHDLSPEPVLPHCGHPSRPTDAHPQAA
jgi:hypothetical protein